MNDGGRVPGPDGEEQRLRRALGEAAGRVPARPWAGPAEVRRRAERRRRGRYLVGGGVGSAVVVVVVVVAVALTTSTPTIEHGPPATAGPTSGHVGARLGSAVELTAEVPAALPSGDAGAAATGEQAFGLALLQRLVAASPTGNVVVSPYSLGEDLLMLELGARGDTAREIAAALGRAGVAAGVQADDWAALTAELERAATDDKVALDDADSVWTAPRFPVLSSYLAAVRAAFDAGVWQVDFGGHPAAAVAAVNAWAARATEGLVPHLLSLGDVQPPPAVALLNAVYLKAEWATLFDNVPATGVFDAPGGPEQVREMTSAGGSQTLDISVGDGVTAVQIPYWNGSTEAPEAGRFAAMVVMPTSESLDSWLSGLDRARWQSLLGSLRSTAVRLTMPRFSFASSTDLDDALGAMGIRTAFSQSADFSALSPVPLQVSLVKQDATLRVNRFGTVASAATAVLMVPTSAQLTTPIDIDRPFLFVVRDTVTGAILFASAVERP